MKMNCFVFRRSAATRPPFIPHYILWQLFIFFFFGKLFIYLLAPASSRIFMNYIFISNSKLPLSVRPSLRNIFSPSDTMGLDSQAVGVSTRGVRSFQWVQTPSCAASPNPWGQDFRPNFVSLGGFQTPPTKMNYTTPHHIPKYEILQREKMWTIPLRGNKSGSNQLPKKPREMCYPVNQKTCWLFLQKYCLSVFWMDFKTFSQKPISCNFRRTTVPKLWNENTKNENKN